MAGRALDGPEVRARIRHALSFGGDASVRVYGYWAGLIVTIREPQDMPRRPHSMTAVPFQRPLSSRPRSTAAHGMRSSRLAKEASKKQEGEETTPLHFQSIAHPGACGKTRVMMQNRRPGLRTYGKSGLIDVNP